MKNQVSLCMIVKDEEEYLPRCLSSIKDIVDEIIIVDTGSSDKTVEIAKNFGAKIYYFKWNNDFSEARNESLKYATKDWILILDADDELNSESKETFKVLLNTELDEKAIYHFETLSYYGNSIDNDNIAINLNPRLFKNNRGIHYEGEVHNQLISVKGDYNAVCNEIKIYHYGYIDKRIISKDKRNRNIFILNEQIKKNPNDGFVYFNLGNEYGALDDMNKALECYYKAYEKFVPNTGYSSLLILRIIIANLKLKNYNKALEFVDIGSLYYPKCTDFYFYKSLIWHELDRPTLQIKALEKCIELGEPPSELKFIFGTWSYRAYYELGNVYMKYKDYNTAYNNYVEALKLKPDYIEPLYNIADVLKAQNVSLEEMKRIMEESFPEDKKDYYNIIADLFYHVGYYSTALEYIKKYEDSVNVTENTIILKSRCLIRNGDFEEYTNINDIDKKSSYYIVFSMYKVLSFILLNKYENALSIVNSINEDNLSDYNKKYLRVYSELIKLFTKEPTKMLSEDENDKEYMNIILEVIEILLINDKFDELAVAVNLLNVVDTKYALLYLGKLYYKHGYIDLAKKEILRSIKEVDIYDAEGLDILKY
ncbi:glycosyltransferase involved in cell wall biosynthesis [Clostridium saccharoperbutylacetonicum]|uniref:Glycosyl transferase family 2 n=1 Tax=Clostridium saccharoperbutylacetonicum N1-4(HMT) TaxID=931276 RepID=M1LS45_9CLOT|nr:glycosyltransferase [Clostridium saccharoperbutylacetonicum]AGF55745.1 glycosyl transferase family 2 [Clostridium saccharoperbutylacetonicum N1-4(HMT)]NRT63523.1 glycosyltransferase involved in cell wall biosynthesis [Clostridium saccharoperbutylacetonicum]NSB26886.1 glycosyltransferase involved in cell wall biosynthesis [Clostridium saccharoperbutylacetonicum]NSB40370.1 glycosyltransferase involved in cell wall biosynthesis [Clostridium saccharoperbutylacetonicum]